MLKLTSLAVLILLLSLACVSNTTEDCSTLTGATFTSSGGQIQSIINTKCSGSACHSPGGPGSVHWTIRNYANLKPFFEHMTEAIENGSMPEAGSTPLTNEELLKFECWAAAGYPE